MQQKKAEDHLKEVEEKAARVDLLERRIANLEMDKDKLNRELNGMHDQISKNNSSGGQNSIKQIMQSNNLMQSQKLNNRQSAPISKFLSAVPKQSNQFRKGGGSAVQTKFGGRQQNRMTMHNKLNNSDRGDFFDKLLGEGN